MTANAERKRIKQHLKEIRVIVREWDPLGLPDSPDDEYAFFEPGIYKRLREGNSLEEMEEHLKSIYASAIQQNLTESGNANIRQYAENFIAWWKQKQEEQQINVR